MSVAAGACVVAGGFLTAIILRDRNEIEERKKRNEMTRVAELRRKRERRLRAQSGEADLTRNALGSSFGRRAQGA